MSRILDAIREAVRSSRVTRYRIAKDTGISQPQLHRLMSGQTGLRMENLERLIDYLDLEIVIRPKRGPKSKR